MKCRYCQGEIEAGATKCKHCGEWLDLAAKVSAEKKAAKAAAALKSRHESQKALGCFGMLVALGLVVFGISALGSHSSQDANLGTTVDTPVQDTQKRRDALVDATAPEYCEASKKTNVVLADSLKAEGAGRLKAGFTAEQCRTIVGKLFDRGMNAGNMHAIARHEYWVGMDYMALYYSVGTPDQFNKTTTGFGESAQLVYEWEPKTVYMYLNGQKVTSYQN